MTDDSIVEKVADLKTHFRILTENVTGPFEVCVREQEDAISRLLPLVDYKHVFFVVDTKTFQIKYVNGTGRWLGYSDSQFGFYEYLSSLNTGMLREYYFYSSALMEECLKGTFKNVGFMKGYYYTCHSIRDYAGNYHYVHRISMPFQLNHKKQITEYLNIIKIIKPYHGEPLHVDMDGLPQSYLDKLKEKVKEMRKDELFGERQQFLIDLCSNYPQITDRQLAEQLNVTVSAVKKSKQRIKSKVKDYYQRDFQFFHQLVSYLKVEGAYYPVQD